MKEKMKFSDILAKETAPRMSILNIAEYPHIKDSELFRVLRQLPKMTKNGPWVAGGAVWRTINNEPLDKCDIDIFFQSQKQFEESLLKMAGLPLVNNVVKEVKNKWNTIYKYHIHENKTFDKTYDVQFINMNFHPNIESLLESFDFTVCQFGYDGENFVCGLSALEDLAAKRIRIYNTAKPKSLFKHLHKYLVNGFSISSEQTRDLAYCIMSMNCWKKSDSPDYDDEENKKAVAEKYVSPFASEEQPEWVGYGYTGVVSTTTAPFVEHENEINPDTMAPRLQRNVGRGDRIENGNRRNRRVAVDAALFQTNTGWIPAANDWQNAGAAQWNPGHAPLPGAAAANPPQVVIQVAGPQALFHNDAPVIARADEQLHPLIEPQANIFHLDMQPDGQPHPAQPVVEEGQYDHDDAWGNYGYAQRIENVGQNPVHGGPVLRMPPNEGQQDVAIRQVEPALNEENVARRVFEQLEREGFQHVPVDINERQHIDRIAERAEELMIQFRNEDRNEEVMAAGENGIADVRQQAHNNAVEAFGNAFRNVRVNPDVNQAAEQEIANDAAQRAENIEHGVGW